MKMHSLVVGLLLSLSVTHAQATYVYSIDFYGVNAPTFIIAPFSYDFTSESILSATTNIPLSTIFNASLPSGYTILAAQLQGPQVQSYPRISTTFDWNADGQWDEETSFGFDGPLDHVGIYDNPQGSGRLVISVAGDPVPEPSTMILLGSGLLALAGAARRKMKK